MRKGVIIRAVAGAVVNCEPVDFLWPKMASAPDSFVCGTRPGPKYPEAAGRSCDRGHYCALYSSRG